VLRCIEYLRRYGYSDQQIYLLLSCAPVQGHIAGIVDVSVFFFLTWKQSFEKLLLTSVAQIPNACTTLGLPIDIFDFDIRPEAPIQKLDMGACAVVSK
jgi:formamidase